MKNKPTIKHRNQPINLNEIRNNSLTRSFENNFPTFFRVARAELADIEQLAKEDNLDAAFLESRSIYAIFRIEHLKRTKRNLREYLKEGGEFREKRIFFYFGEPHTTIAYRNPIIQTFFEFGLYYSWITKTELSTAKAKTLFIKICKVSMNMSLGKKEEPQIFYDFLDFIQGNSWSFNAADFNRKQDEKTKLILGLNAKGKKPSAKTIEIVGII